jgi:hypothetical protein
MKAELDQLKELLDGLEEAVDMCHAHESDYVDDAREAIIEYVQAPIAEQHLAHASDIVANMPLQKKRGCLGEPRSSPGLAWDQTAWARYIGNRMAS